MARKETASMTIRPTTEQDQVKNRYVGYVLAAKSLPNTLLVYFSDLSSTLLGEEALVHGVNLRSTHFGWDLIQ